MISLDKWAPLSFTKIIITIIGSCIAHITLDNVSMRIQKPLDIIILALAPAAVISAQCISRNNPTRYPLTSLTWLGCGKCGLMSWKRDISATAGLELRTLWSTVLWHIHSTSTPLLNYTLLRQRQKSCSAYNITRAHSPRFFTEFTAHY